MERGLVIIEELVNFIGLSCWVLTVKMRELKPQGSSMHQSVPLMRIVMVVIELSTMIVLMMPTRIGKEPVIITVLAVLTSTFTAIETRIISFINSWKRVNALVTQMWYLRGWSCLSGYQSAEQV
jgi:hypothetical protein